MLMILLACQSSPSAGTEIVAPAAAGSTARSPRVRSVDCRGQGDYLDILDALDDADSGDTLWVAPCTYYGSISFHGKSVAIRSTGGAAVTTVLGNPGEAVVKVKNGEGPGTVLAGFTLSGGGGVLTPAIDDEFSMLTLRDDVITGNAGTVTVYNRSGRLVIDRTRLEANTPSEGMVIQSRRGEVALTHSAVACDGALIGYEAEHAGAFVDGTTFGCAGATAVEVYHSVGRVQRSTLDGLLYVENERTGTEPTVVEDSVLLAGATVTLSDLTLRNTVTADVTANAANLVVEASVITGATCGITATTSSVTTRYDTLWNNVADACGTLSPLLDGTSFAADPGFLDAAGGDYHLGAGSPCIDAGPTEGAYRDPDASTNDIGAFGGPLAGGA